MRAKHTMQRFIAAGLLLAIYGGAVHAEISDLQNQLGKELKIELKDVTIAEALAKISQKADINIVLSSEAAWKLPQGEATRLSVKLDGPLSASLTEMLSTFFMRYATGDNDWGQSLNRQVTIYPKEELDHIMGRPTINQLEILKRIYTFPIRGHFPGQSQKTINFALGTTVTISPLYVYEQLDKLLCKQINKTEKSETNETSAKQYDLPTPVTIVQLLNEVEVKYQNNQYPAEATRWYISGTEFPGQIPEIKVVTSRELLRAKLSQKIDVTYKDELLSKIFQDLANRGGMTLRIQPGSRLSDRPLGVSIQNMNALEAIQKVADIMDAIVDYRDEGDKFTVAVKGFYIDGNNEKKPGDKAPSSDGSGSYVGKISVPMNGGEYFIEFMLRESDLTNELKNLRQEKISDILKQLQKGAEQKAPTAGSTK